jgi:hypothetical protein
MTGLDVHVRVHEARLVGGMHLGTGEGVAVGLDLDVGAVS